MFIFLVPAFFSLLKIGTGFYKKGIIAVTISRIRIIIAGVLKVNRLAFYPGGV